MMSVKLMVPLSMMLFAAPGTKALDRDPLLQRSVVVDGKSRSVSQALEQIQNATGRNLIKSRLVPDSRVYICATSAPASIILDEFTLLLTDQDFTYAFEASQAGVDKCYIFQALSMNRKARELEAERRFFAILNHPDTPSLKAPRDPNSYQAPYVAARYDLLRGLPAATLHSAVKRALDGQRVILPLRLFDPAVLKIAHGSVRVMRTNPATGQRHFAFSYEEVDRGNGFVALESRLRGGNQLGLRLKIGSGQPPASSRTPFPGPSSDLILGLDQEDAIVRTAARRPVPPTSHPPTVLPPAALVTIRAKAVLRANELPLENVLRQLAESSHLPVLARWQNSGTRYKSRLVADLVKVPLTEAANTIAKSYALKCDLTEDGIRFRPSDSPAEAGARSASTRR